jgi:hypothetical protein
MATAARGDEIAKFRIELIINEPKRNELFTFTKGALIREGGADGQWFLAELGRLLKARSIPEKATPLDRLAFDATILGMSQSRDGRPDQPADAYASDPPGNWIVTKVFVANGDGEFYLNLNPTDGCGEISLKDEEYGDIVVRELAMILLSKDAG